MGRAEEVVEEGAEEARAGGEGDHPADARVVAVGDVGGQGGAPGRSYRRLRERVLRSMDAL